MPKLNLKQKSSVFTHFISSFCLSFSIAINVSYKSFANFGIIEWQSFWLQQQKGNRLEQRKFKID